MQILNKIELQIQSSLDRFLFIFGAIVLHILYFYIYVICNKCIVNQVI